MSGRHRVAAAGVLLLGILAAVVLLVFAGNACPVETDAQACPDASRNLVVGIVLTAVTVALVVTPFAFLAEVMTRRRIVYRGAWGRAARRGLLAAAVIAVLAGLRLGGALTVPTAIFVLVLAGVVEWFFIRNDT